MAGRGSGRMRGRGRPTTPPGDPAGLPRTHPFLWAEDGLAQSRRSSQSLPGLVLCFLCSLWLLPLFHAYCLLSTAYPLPCSLWLLLSPPLSVSVCVLVCGCFALVFQSAALGVPPPSLSTAFSAPSASPRLQLFCLAAPASLCPSAAPPFPHGPAAAGSLPVPPCHASFSAPSASPRPQSGFSVPSVLFVALPLFSAYCLLPSAHCLLPTISPRPLPRGVDNRVLRTVS